MGQRLINIEFHDLESRYRRISLTPRMPNFGALVDGVDLNGELDGPTRAELKSALSDFGVLFFTSQKKLPPDTHASLARIFGSGAHEGAFFLERPKDSPAVEYLTNDRERPPGQNLWHTDISWHSQPPIATIIQIQETPAVGGNTAWACMHKAYDYLSDATQAYLEGLTAIHSWEKGGIPARMKAVGMDHYVNLLRRYPPVEHPVVIRHPRTGRKALYVNETFTMRIKDLQPKESDGVLKMIFDWIQQPEFQVVHKWAENDVAVWDNFSTQHYALADYWPARRVNQRITVAA